MILDFRSNSPRLYHVAGGNYVWTGGFQAFGFVPPDFLFPISIIGELDLVKDILAQQLTTAISGSVIANELIGVIDTLNVGGRIDASSLSGEVLAQLVQAKKTVQSILAMKRSHSITGRKSDPNLKGVL